MKTDEIRNRLTTLLAERKNAPMTAGEIATALRLKAATKKKLQKWLHALVLEGSIVPVRGNRYSLGAPADLVTGKLRVFRSGAGVVVPADGARDVFLPKEAMGTALPGDIVVARMSPESKDADARGPEGKMIRIVERGTREIVGTLRSTGRFFYVVPINPVYKQSFYVPDVQGAKLNDRVVVRFVNWENKHINPEAEIVEVIGPEDKPSVDTISVIRHYGLRDEFPPDALREAETTSRLLARPGRRLDLRTKLVITIDPDTARDFDDALSLERDAKGNRVLGVHIADVSHFLRPGSALDEEARERGNSVYLPDKVIPMIPEQLSNGVCSLNPDVDRLTFSAFLTLDASGNVRSSEFARSRIRSSFRLTYKEAMATIAGKGPARGDGQPPLSRDAVALIKDLHKLAQQLRKKRFARFALELDVPECKVVTGPDGRMAGIEVLQNDPSHQLVEECMVAANEAVATVLSRHEVPFPSRVHEPPTEERLEGLAAELADMGYTPGDLSNRKNLAAFLKSVADDPLAGHVRVAVLKSMNRAVYSHRADGHFGLAKQYYAHFTSPIRRYPDLVLHRQLAAWLQSRQEGQGGQTRKRPFVYAADQIARVSEHCSLTEQTAEEAERALLELMKLRYLAAQVADGTEEVYQAAVVKATNFGLFVEIDGLQIQGLVHVSSISSDFVPFNRNKQTLRAGSKVYRVGTRMAVKVVKVDLDNRRVDFVPADAPHGLFIWAHEQALSIE